MIIIISFNYFDYYKFVNETNIEIKNVNNQSNIIVDNHLNKFPNSKIYCNQTFIPSSICSYIFGENLITLFSDRKYVNEDNIYYIRSKIPKLRENDLFITGEDVLIEGLDVFDQFLVVSERKQGLLQLCVMNFKNDSMHYIPFNEPTYVVGTNSNLVMNTSVLRYSYNSMVNPGTMFEYNMETKESKILKEKEIVGGYNKDNYASERVWAEGRDGTKIPMSMVYKKGMQKDGKNPTLLYAYGSYGYSIDPTFSSNRLTLLDRGFIFVIAHIRGGEDLGRMWYENGKLLKKKNTFYDFIDCGKHLIENNFCSSENLYAAGGSAGGLLMGAVINMAPTLFNGVIAHVPFVDVVTTMLDESIPLTTGEYDEWGNPNELEYYNYMLSYSPYDNIQKMNYPNLLVTTGLHDSQVQYWEPAKWVAKLRELKTDDNLLILKTNMKAGHGGSSGRFEYLKEIALDYAFLFKLEGFTQ